MKGDFSRLELRPEKRYSSVLMQQGRAQVDSDWNEHATIEENLRERALADVIGPCAAPASGGGFRISATPAGEIRIGAGRIYVEGVLCELEREGGYDEQPHFPEPAPIEPGDGHRHLVYIDVWKRYVTAVEDPGLREPALGGADTSTRVQTIWQVKALPDPGEAANCAQAADRLPPPSDGRLTASAIRYEGRDNRLYRVEIHDSGAPGEATFKWSRENGSCVASIARLDVDGREAHARLGYAPSGSEDALGLGDLVELTTEADELCRRPGIMAEITDVAKDGTVALSGEVAPFAGMSGLRARRWEGGPVAVSSQPIELEEGIAVSFTEGSYASGDWWAFSARPGSGDGGWPSEALAHGPRHRRAALALVEWRADRNGGWRSSIIDCRAAFGPLADLAGCRGCCEAIDELRARLDRQDRLLRSIEGRPGSGATR